MIRGPFDGIVSISRRRLSLQVGTSYAGSVPVVVGRQLRERVGGSLSVLAAHGRAYLDAALLTREVSGSWRAGAAGALIMSVVPAHLMRSVGGGYDNESVAMTAMCLTFLVWCVSVRNKWTALILGPLAGLAYANMVAAWGGYIFVLNMVGVHAAFLVAVEPMHTPIDERVAHRGPLFGIAHGQLRAHQMAGSGGEALYEERQVEPLGEAQRLLLDPGDGRVGRLHVKPPPVRARHRAGCAYGSACCRCRRE
jgi:hypothetical protein